MLYLCYRECFRYSKEPVRAGLKVCVWVICVSSARGTAGGWDMRDFAVHAYLYECMCSVLTAKSEGPARSYGVYDCPRHLPACDVHWVWGIGLWAGIHLLIFAPKIYIWLYIIST